MKARIFSLILTAALTQFCLAQTPGNPSANGLIPKTGTFDVNIKYNHTSTESTGVGIAATGNVIIGWEDDYVSDDIEDFEATWTLYSGTGALLTPPTTITNFDGSQKITNVTYRAFFRANGSPMSGYAAWGPKIKANLFGNGLGMGATAYGFAVDPPNPTLAAIQSNAAGENAGDFPAVQLLNNDGTPAGIVSGMSDADAEAAGNVRIGDWDYLSNGNIVIVGESRQADDFTRFGFTPGGNFGAVYRIVTPAGVEARGYSAVSSTTVGSSIWHGVGVTSNGFAVRFDQSGTTVRMFDNDGNPTGQFKLATLTGNPETGGGGRGDGTGFHGNGKDAYVVINTSGGIPWLTVLNANGTVRYSRKVVDGTNTVAGDRVDAAINADGRVIAVWDDNQDWTGSGTKFRLPQGRLFSANGTPEGGIFWISERDNATNSAAIAGSQRPRVAWRGNDVAIIWESLNSPATVDRVVAARLFTVPPAGLVAQTLMEFNFNEGSGTNVTSADGKLVGTFVVTNGPPTFSTDTPSGLAGDYSLQFAAGQRVIVPDPNKLLTLDTNDRSFTVQAWLKFTTPSARSVFFYNNGPGGAVSASVNTNRTAYVTTLGVLDISSTAAIPNDGGWHHVAIVHQDKKEFRFYVDGVLSGTQAYTSGVIFTRTNQVFYIGSENTGGLQYVGLLDRLRYSKGALPPDQLDSARIITVQKPSNVVGSGANAWNYLIMEGESYYSKLNSDPAAGFAKVFAGDTRTDFYGTPILATNTTASGKGALFTQTIFSQWVDKATYKVQFATPGTYYLYMRFTMFENGGNTNHYLNEDSFFLPPDFDKDPQNDWPIPQPTPNGQSGGYVEGCCDIAGFLRIPEVGTGGIPRVDHGADINYWEGNFHWNDLISSQFLNPATVGAPSVRFKYEVTPDKVGRPLNFTIGYREGGVTIDLFLFSTHANLMDVYTQAQLDQVLLSPNADVTVQKPSDVVGSGTNAWKYLVLEGESYSSKLNPDPAAGFAKVYAGDTRTDFYGTPILATNTTASGKGALFTQTIFSQWADKATYRVQFATPGTYYLYMRFTMFENGGNTNHFLNEDSFFLPPDFDKDPQNDWPIPQPTPNGQSGGYVEGCCDIAGFLRIPEVGTGGIPRVDHGADINYWEGNFHWNDLISSQFLNPATVGAPSVRFKYEVTPDKVGHPLNFTIGYREGGVTIDLFLFSTHSNLLNVYTQEDLNRIFHVGPFTIGGVASAGVTTVVPDRTIFNTDTPNLDNWEPSISVLGNSTFLIEANTFAADGLFANQRYGVAFQPAAGGTNAAGDGFYADNGSVFRGQINNSRQNGNPGRVAGDKRPGAVNFIAGGEASLHAFPEFQSAPNRWNNNAIYADPLNRYAAVQTHSLNTSTLTQTPLMKAFDVINGRYTKAFTVPPGNAPEVSRFGGELAGLDNGNFVVVVDDRSGLTDTARSTTAVIIRPDGSVVKETFLVDPRDTWSNLAAYKGGFCVRVHDKLYFYDNAGTLKGSVDQSTSGVSFDAGRGDGTRIAAHINSPFVFLAGIAATAAGDPRAARIAAFDSRNQSFVTATNVSEADLTANFDRANLAADALDRVAVAYEAAVLSGDPPVAGQQQVVARVLAFNATAKTFSYLTPSFYPFVNFNSSEGALIRTQRPSVAMTTRQICIAAKGEINSTNNPAAGPDTLRQTTFYTVISHPDAQNDPTPSVGGGQLAIASITASGANVTITWTGGTGPYQLQSRPALGTGNWANVGAATSSTSATVPVSGATSFFRVQGQ